MRNVSTSGESRRSLKNIVASENGSIRHEWSENKSLLEGAGVVIGTIRTMNALENGSLNRNISAR